jgi:hypothetical protein
MAVRAYSVVAARRQLGSWNCCSIAALAEKAHLARQGEDQLGCYPFRAARYSFVFRAIPLIVLFRKIAVPVGPATCIMNLRHAMRDIDQEAAKPGDDPSLHLKRSRPPIGRIEQRI